MLIHLKELIKVLVDLEQTGQLERTKRIDIRRKVRNQTL